ncbi:S1C family serine protease [Nannocystis pusilla]|uniref:S1C family serine protease n=1 Tax=Nannocystis pusilla TaxID=889268 RepID=A0ABS7TUV9_9BACT|nr:S1C family serine protease [Nannocystis pusilla]
MRTLFVAGLVALVACRPLDDAAPSPVSSDSSKSAPPPSAPPPQRPSRPTALPDFAAVTEQIAPSVVSVICTLPQAGGRAKRGIGSGTLVRADGLVVTNAHVVPLTASEIDVQYANQERVRAQVIHREPLLDLAVIAPDPPRVDQAPVVFRERPVRPGEWVLAVGHPFGLGDTVTVGVVSGLGRDWADVGKPEDLPQDGFFSFVQTDASINTGSSGGPIVDLRGEVLGIATAVRGEGTGIGFAVPAPMVRRYLEEVLTHGRFRRVRLGIRAVDDDEFPGRLATVKITRVEAAGPGAKAGLQVDDFILSVAGQPVHRVSEVAYLTQLIGVDGPIEMQVQRAGEPLRSVTLAPVEGL